MLTGALQTSGAPFSFKPWVFRRIEEHPFQRVLFCIACYSMPTLDFARVLIINTFICGQDSDDIRYMAGALKTLGIKLEENWEKGEMVVHVSSTCTRCAARNTYCVLMCHVPCIQHMERTIQARGACGCTRI